MSDQSNRSMQQGANTAASASRGAVRGGKAAYRAGKTAVRAGKTFISLPAPVQIGIAIALVIVLLASVIVGGTSSTSMDETWYLTAEHEADKDHQANSPKTEEELTSVESEYNSVEKTSNLAAIIHEVKAADRQALEAQLQKTYPDKQLTIECDTDTEEYYISDVFSISGTGSDGTAASAIQAAIDWAVEKANDDSWGYPSKHRAGCYICGTSPTKEYTCMPFITAAYAHGAGDPEILKICKKGHSLSTKDTAWKNNKCFELVGRCKDLNYEELQPGDVLVQYASDDDSGHMCMFIGDGKLVHAAGHSVGIVVTKNAKKTFNSYKRGSNRLGEGHLNFVMRYVGQGGAGAGGSSGNAEKIAATAEKLAWPENSTKKDYCKKNGGKPTAAEKAAAKAVGMKPAADCGHFVTVVLRTALGNKNIPNFLNKSHDAGKDLSKMQSITSKYGLTALKWDGKVSSLRRGDVLIYKNKGNTSSGTGQHAFIYLGGRKVAEASYTKKNYGHIAVKSPGKGVLKLGSNRKYYYVLRAPGGDATLSGSRASGASSIAGNQQVVNGALAWARKIAADDSWTYGHGSFRCCICNNMGIKKFTCMPFIAAAYAHGGGDPIMMDHGTHRINLHDGNFKGNLGKIWKKIGLCKNLTINDLQPGDVVIKWSSDNEHGHAWMYGGNDEVIEATGGAGIRVTTGAAKRLKRYGTSDGLTSRNYVMRYVGTGTGGTASSAGAARSTGVTAGRRSQSSQDVINGACAWAEAIAADDSFHYGACNKAHPGVRAGTKPKVNNNHTMCSHHSGCYFCKTNDSRELKWVVDKDKTYCCNPFVHAAFAHGGGEPTMLKICKKGRSYGFSKGEGYDTSRLFKSVGKVGVSKLQKGDVLCASSHVMLYIGNGKVAEAGSRDDNVRGSTSWKKSIHVAKVKSSQYDRVYRYIGHGGGTMEMPSGAGGSATAKKSASDLKSYSSEHILSEIKLSDGTSKTLNGNATYSVGQSMALTNSGALAVSWDHNPSIANTKVALYDEKGTEIGSEKVKGYHSNAMTVAANGNIWVGGWMTAGSTTVAVLNESGNKLTSAGTKGLPASCSSGLAYDKETGKYILGTGATIRVYNSSLSKVERTIRKIHGASYQDIGASEGVIYVCHSLRKGNKKAGSGNNYIDLYRESDGDYLGSYHANFGEVESCVIKGGELIVLHNIKGTRDCVIHWTGIKLLGGDGSGGFGFNSGALDGTTGISKSDLEILSAYSVSLANTELVFLEDAEKTTSDNATTGRYFNKLESKLGSKAGKPVKLFWFGEDRGKADYEGDLKRKLEGAVLYDREYEISESGDAIKITLKQRKAHEIMRDAFGLDPNASYVNATTKMTATALDESESGASSTPAGSTQEGINKSIEWARKIAADDRFTYGKGYGDYYDCPVCHGSTKKSELKYTCNPFVAAAFAHGTGDPILMNHGYHKVRTSDWNFEGKRAKVWKKVGLCKNLTMADLQPGDILINYAAGVGGHACIYGGGDEIIEAVSSGSAKDQIRSKKHGAAKRLKSYSKGSKNFVMRYIGSGGGDSTADDGSDSNKVYTGLEGGATTNGKAGYTLAENTAQLLFNGKTELRTITMGSGSSMEDVLFGGYANGGELLFPLPQGVWKFTSDYGWRWGRLHSGVDLGCSGGTPIYAAAAGTVVRAEYYGGYGNCIDIDHGGGMVTRYGHQSKLIAKKGETVQAGQKIGEVGNTGHSFGNHLHFEVHVNGKAIDPKPYIGMAGKKAE